PHMLTLAALCRRCPRARPPSCSISVRRAALLVLFFFSPPATTAIYTLSLHDALPISSAKLFVPGGGSPQCRTGVRSDPSQVYSRSEEHTSELQSRSDLVCRLLLEKKKTRQNDDLLLTLIVRQSFATRLFCAGHALSPH